MTNDTIYLNRGNGSFAERLLGGATARNGMSSEVADVTGDGRPDVFVTNIYVPLEEHRGEMSEARYRRVKRLFDFAIKSDRTKGNTLLVNQGDGEFVDRAPEYGVRHGGWGWAASLTDFDNDGDRDLVQATQAVVRLDRDDPKWTLAQVWAREGERFARVNASVHGIGEHDTRGMATLDYDHDGDRDLVMATYGGPLVLYENVVSASASPAGSDGANAVQFEVVTESGATALGATVTVEAGNRTIHVRQTDENDFLSRESRVQHVGLGDAETATLTVTWPDGTERTVEVEAGERVRISKDGVEVTADLTGG